MDNNEPQEWYKLVRRRLIENRNRGMYGSWYSSYRPPYKALTDIAFDKITYEYNWSEYDEIQKQKVFREYDETEAAKTMREMEQYFREWPL